MTRLSMTVWSAFIRWKLTAGGTERGRELEGEASYCGGGEASDPTSAGKMLVEKRYVIISVFCWNKTDYMW
jgi:hypothetical protein